MKKYLLFICLIFMSMLTYAQDEEAGLDALRAPASPASNLLGTATTDIDKPTDLKSFMLSIQSASGSYTKIPSNYAVDFAPFYIFKKNTDFTTEGLLSKEYKDVFKQTFVISTAITKPDSTSISLNHNSTYAAIGFKFSIFRGKYSSTTEDKLNAIKSLQKNLLDQLRISVAKYFDEKEGDSENIELLKEYNELVKKRNDLFFIGVGINESEEELNARVKRVEESKEYIDITNELNKLLDEFINSGKAKSIMPTEEQKEIKSKIKSLASDFQLERVGFSWDVNGGISNEFRNNNFDNSKIYNAGLWTNFGYTNEKGVAFLGLVRYLYNPDKIYALDNNINEYDNTSTLDFGGRIAYSKSQSKFSCSIEAIYRSAFSDIDIDPTWKMLFNADYSIFKNQKLTFSFGKDFDGTITKEGNLIAALTFIQGFGN